MNTAALSTAARSVAHAPDEKLHDYLLAAAAVFPDKAAVVDVAEEGGPRSVSYAELGGMAAGYRDVLAEHGFGCGDRVVIEAHNSSVAIAAMLACSSLGMPFIPISPEVPDARLRRIVEVTEPALHLRTADARRDPSPAAGWGDIRPDGLDVVRAPRWKARHRREVVSTDTAYVIFTSGSTGTPKGVVMSHRAVVSFYRGMLRSDIVDHTARVASTSPWQFDFSLLDTGLALGSGATVVPVPRAVLRWPTRFLGVLGAVEATQVNGVPSIWRQVLRHAPHRLAELHHLRGILYCGEDFPVEELRALQRCLPGARIVNCYGSTESMACSFAVVPHPLPEGLDAPSIGRAHPDAEMVLVDEDGQIITRPGVVGEIHLHSSALFSGYWDDDQATRATLVPDPAEPRSGKKVLRTGDLAHRDEQGDFHFRGRRDAQVQIRGNRVELGELEHRLTEHPAVVQAAAFPTGRPEGADALAAVVVLREAAEDTALSQLTAFCAETLPSYMVPESITAVTELPLSANGKLDRRRLPTWPAKH